MGKLNGQTAQEYLDDLADRFNEAEKQAKSEEEIINIMKASVPANRFGQANEVANAIAFLSTPAASYINGINVPVDGGRTQSL